MNQEISPFTRYLYQSPIGKIRIRRNAASNGSWLLCFDKYEFAPDGLRLLHSEPASIWPTPEAAAAAVLNQETRFRLWDTLPFVVFPKSLQDWQEEELYGTAPVQDSQ